MTFLCARDTREGNTKRAPITTVLIKAIQNDDFFLNYKIQIKKKEYVLNEVERR